MAKSLLTPFVYSLCFVYQGIVILKHIYNCNAYAMLCKLILYHTGHSLSISTLFCSVALDSVSILGTLDVRLECTLEGMPVHCRVPCTHILKNVEETELGKNKTKQNKSNYLRTVDQFD